MKRFVLSLLAASLLAAPAAYAQPSHNPRIAAHGNHKPAPPPAFDRGKAHAPQVRARQAVRHHWAVGRRVPVAQRGYVVRDYGRYGLHRPGRGQHWIKVDNEYLLVGIASGLVAGLIAAH